MKTVAIIDKSKLFSDLLKSGIEASCPDEFKVMDVFQNYKSLEKLIKKPVDIVVVDCDTTDVSKTSLLREVIKNNKESKLIFLNNQDNPKVVRQALKLGALGFINKKCSFDEVIMCLKEVSKGEIYVDKRIKWNDFSVYNESLEFGSLGKLTDREVEIIELLSEGLTNVDIGQTLYISSQTVAVHRKNILRKYNAKNVAHLIKLYCEGVK